MEQVEKYKLKEHHHKQEDSCCCGQEHCEHSHKQEHTHEHEHHHGHTHEHEHHHEHDGSCCCGQEHTHQPVQHPDADHAKGIRFTCLVENLGCANCAAKMERRINELPEVNAAVLRHKTASCSRYTGRSEKGRRPDCKISGNLCFH